jgi:hypothetical protein
VARGSLGRTLVSRFGWNHAGGEDRLEQGRGLGNSTPIGGPQVAATEARMR